MTATPLPGARFADFVPPALIAGLVCGFALGLPVVGLLNCACCAPVILCGFWAAYMLSRRLTPQGALFQPLHGVLAGVLAGVICGVTNVIVGAVFKAILGDPAQKMIEELLRNMSSMPPEARRALDQAFARGMSAVILVISLVVTPVLYACLAAVGGLLGALAFKPKKPPVSGGWSAPTDIAPTGGAEPPVSS